MEARTEALVWLHQQVEWERRLDELAGRARRVAGSSRAAEIEERLAA